VTIALLHRQSLMIPYRLHAPHRASWPRHAAYLAGPKPVRKTLAILHYLVFFEIELLSTALALQLYLWTSKKSSQRRLTDATLHYHYDFLPKKYK
jgi:hypothetical protein